MPKSRVLDKPQTASGQRWGSDSTSALSCEGNGEGACRTDDTQVCRRLKAAPLSSFLLVEVESSSIVLPMLLRNIRFHTILASLSLMTAGPGSGAILAFTDFDASTASGNSKSGLNWTLNGLEDPGSLSAFQFEGGAINLFDANSFVQDIFIPGINTGNGNTSWTTDLGLTVEAGFNVTLTDITFNSVSVNGGQAENVNRRNDYSVTILDPTNTPVASITVADTLAGTTAGQPLVTLDFADVVLDSPGSYTMIIRGGDFIGDNETGNHTGLDHLSINGNVSAIPEPSALLLSTLGLLGFLTARRRN